MRLEKWFISNLDDLQGRVVTQSIEENLVVSGAAGSGKTNLAIYRALQAKNRGNYAIVVSTIALRRMIAYGMDALKLDKERVMYDWSRNNRGFDLEGDVYCEYERQGGEINNRFVYLVNAGNVRKFERVGTNNPVRPDFYGLDFGDWVDYRFYKAFGRRESEFQEVILDGEFSVVNRNRYELIPAGIIYKPIDGKIDYLVIDEAQDFGKNQYADIRELFGKSISLFGDSNQQIMKNGCMIEELAIMFGGARLNLEYNYRIPKTIAKVAQQISTTNIDLISRNRKNNGRSDFPDYPKPLVVRCKSESDELRWILNRIRAEDLDDVAILVKDDKDVKKVTEYFQGNGVNTQVFYRTGKEVPFHTINTLDFLNNDLPCVLTYKTAKGSEFENVFVPFSDQGSAYSAYNVSRHEFYVACTRSSRNLCITYSGRETPYLEDVSKNDIQEISVG